jgi:hypothetical protein
MSIENNCSEAADLMSCAAMVGMAKQETRENLQQLSYLVNDPSCERFHTPYDRTLEHKVQISGESISRKLCVTKTPEFGQGTWINMTMPPLGRIPVNFDQWTKNK